MKNEHALITGATAGIGLATAELLAAQGATLTLTGRRENILVEVANRLRQTYQVRIETLAFDVRDHEACASALASIQDVSILVNNAGLALGNSSIEAHNVDDWNTMIDTNIKGVLSVTKLILPHMLQAKKGHIINLGSVAGRWAYKGGAVYCGTKFFVRAMTESLRMDLLGTPIRVTNIEPGMVETEFSEVRMYGDKQKARAVYEGMQPLTAQDIAETILWCLQRPPHVNIQEIVIYPTDQAAIGQVHRK